MTRTTYRVTWHDQNRLRCIIHDAMTNQFMLRGPETPEERLERKALEERSTPEDNLRRLMRNHLDAQWRATELYPWFEQHAPGYKIGRAGKRSLFGPSDVGMIFAHIDHAVLFKLTWM